MDRSLTSMDDFKQWFSNIFEGHKVNKGREMKRVFQLRRYLEWQDLTAQEKLTVKRILLIPVLAIPILGIIRIYSPLILTGLIMWFLYRRFEKGGLTKK